MRYRTGQFLIYNYKIQYNVCQLINYNHLYIIIHRQHNIHNFLSTHSISLMCHHDTPRLEYLCY